jgi:hypothetical protein
LDLGEIPCGRCTDTGANLREVITGLGEEHLLDNVELELENTFLPPERMEESNTVLINWVPVEKIFSPGVTFVGCSRCLDRTVEQGHCPEATDSWDIFKAIPAAEMIRAAILKVLERG